MSERTFRINPHIAALQGYTPGKQPVGDGWIKLNTNESPFPPPDSVKAAILAEVGRLARYPSPTSAPLRRALAEKFDLDAGRVIIGNGSDDILNLLARSFGGVGKRLVQTDPSYSLYPVVTALAGGEIISVPFASHFELPVSALLAAEPDLLFLTCPNAPTGVRFPQTALIQLLEQTDATVVVDEAYAEFAKASTIPLIQRYPNLFVTRTFSKAFGLAGLRVGYGMGDPGLIAVLDKVRESYNVNRLSQAGALAALQEAQHYDKQIKRICATRELVKGFLDGLGWQVYPSEANFLFAAPTRAGSPACPEVASDLFAWLESSRILVRRFPTHPLTAAYLRISIGSESEMESFMNKVEEWQNHD